MKTSNLIKVCGSITKKESLIPVNYNILKNTYDAEANNPYFGYYGMVPEQANPNSLFLFTIHLLKFIKERFAKSILNK